jgi:hypothetical protein
MDKNATNNEFCKLKFHNVLSDVSHNIYLLSVRELCDKPVIVNINNKADVVSLPLYPKTLKLSK